MSRYPFLVCGTNLKRNQIPIAEDGLGHPFAQEFHNAEDEPAYPDGPIHIAVDDNTKLSASDYRSSMSRPRQTGVCWPTS